MPPERGIDRQPTEAEVLPVLDGTRAADRGLPGHEAMGREDRHGQLSRPTTVEGMRVLLGMSGYLRQFVTNYSMIVAPTSSLLRDPRFRTKKARKKKVPWGEENEKAFHTLGELLISPPIFTLPGWNEPFQLHTDAREKEAGAVLTQEHNGVENMFVYVSHRWSKTDTRRSVTDRECIAVMWAIHKLQPYVSRRSFTLISDSSVLCGSLEAKYSHSNTIGGR